MAVVWKNNKGQTVTEGGSQPWPVGTASDGRTIYSDGSKGWTKWTQTSSAMQSTQPSQYGRTNADGTTTNFNISPSTTSTTATKSPVTNNGGAGLETAPSTNTNTASNFNEALIKSVSDSIIALEDKLANLPGITFTDSELNAFTQKATDEVTPYYETKKAEIEKGIEEGKIRSAEDIAMQMRQVSQDTESLLAKYDINKAQSEEELSNTLAQITLQAGDNMEIKKAEWADKIRTSQQGQVKSGILTSGIGKQQITNVLNQQDLEKKAMQDVTAGNITNANTTAKYDLQTIALARLTAEQNRNRQIGTPEEQAKTDAALRTELGLGANDVLPSDAEIARLRAERNTNPIVGTSQLTDNAQNLKLATESRKLELQESEEAIRKAEREKQASIIQNQISAKQRDFTSLMSSGGYFS